MKAVAIGPTLWLNAADDPNAAQAAVADLLSMLRRGELQPFTTEELRASVMTSAPVLRLLEEFRDPSYARRGVVADRLVDALFWLLTEAWVPAARCLWDRLHDVVDATAETDLPPNVHDDFIEALATASIEFAHEVSSQVFSGPSGSRIGGRVLDIMCPGDEVDEHAFSYVARSPADAWLATSVGDLPSPGANLEAAMVGRDPALPWRIHPDFQQSVATLPDTRPARLREVYRACAVAISRDPIELGRHGDEPLALRARRLDDRARPRRLRIVNVGPAAPRLHYWLGDTYVEIGVAVRHDESWLPD